MFEYRFRDGEPQPALRVVNGIAQFPIVRRRRHYGDVRFPANHHSRFRGIENRKRYRLRRGRPCERERRVFLFRRPRLLRDGYGKFPNRARRYRKPHLARAYKRRRGFFGYVEFQPDRYVSRLRVTFRGVRIMNVHLFLKRRFRGLEYRDAGFVVLPFGMIEPRSGLRNQHGADGGFRLRHRNERLHLADGLLRFQ